MAPWAKFTTPDAWYSPTTPSASSEITAPPPRPSSANSRIEVMIRSPSAQADLAGTVVPPVRQVGQLGPLHLEDAPAPHTGDRRRHHPRVTRVGVGHERRHVRSGADGVGD